MIRRLLLGALALATATTLPAVAAGHLPTAPGHAQDGGHWQPLPDDHWQGHGTDPTNPAACDPIDPAQCMLPYPNDWFTKPDPTSLTTGRRLDLTVLGMPHNIEGKPIEPQEWNRSDGFSAGAQILTYVPGMTKNADIAASGIPPVTNLGANDTEDENGSEDSSGVILLDTQTGKRVPVWGEVDQYVDEAGLVQTGSVQQDLMIHPAVNLADGRRYIVALRHLVTDNGAVAQPSAAFKAYRDGTATDARAAHMNQIFDALEKKGWARKGLYLAWDFTTASTANVTGRLLHIRDDAFALLGDTDLTDGKPAGDAPAFTVESTTDYTAQQDSRVVRQITGHFKVPCYIAPTCEPPTKCDQVTQGAFHDCPTPGQFALDPTNPDALPQQVGGQTYSANFVCNIGRSAAFANHEKLRPVEYGHGLFGGAGEVNSSPQKDMASKFGMVYCATDWTGMASADIPNAFAALHDLSRFPWITDRVQQGELNFLYLARLMVSAKGFSSSPAFRYADGAQLIDTQQAYYDGNSQGGIYGGTVCAVSVDVRKCVLGVPGMDYSILLPRSSDYVATAPLSAFDPTQFDPTDPTAQVGFSSAFDAAYPDQSQRQLILDLLQTLWDRSDPNGYASHMTGGLPNTPTHQVLLQLGYGDHQVANITAETEARTIGAHGFYPPVVPARMGDYQDLFWGIEPITETTYDGSGITMFDTGPAGNVTPEGHHGTNPPPTADVPNRSGEDPHEAPRRAACGQAQKDAFLRPDGLVTATCVGAPYFAWSWNGTAGL